MIRDRAGELFLIARVVRESNSPTQRSRDVLDVCEIARRNVTAVMSVTLPDPAASRCPTCEARRVADRAKVARWRANRRHDRATS